MPAQAATRPRFIGLDIIRLISFVAIAYFHISLIVYYQRDVPLSDVSWFAAAIEVYARTLAFSGFTILFLTSLLIAYSGKSLMRRLGLFSFLICGWIIFCLFMGYSYSDFLVWDIYPLIVLGILTATLAEKYSLNLVNILAFFGIMLLCIPFWQFAELVSMSELWRNVLGFAYCDKDISEWPVLPWIGLVWLGYGCGVALRRVIETGGARLDSAELKVTRPELGLWVVLLGASTLAWGPYYNIQLGDRFSCEAYRMAPYIFWSHLIWPIFFIRLSVAPRVNAWLTGLKPALWVAELHISRKFFLGYFLSFLICHLFNALWQIEAIQSSGVANEWAVALAVIYLPTIEYATRITSLLLTLLVKKMTPAKSALS